MTLCFPGVCNLHKHSIFFCVQKKNECVPGRNDALLDTFPVTVGSRFEILNEEYIEELNDKSENENT